GTNAPLLFRGHEPDIAVLHRVAVVLQEDRAGRTRVAAEAGRRVVLGQLDVVVDLDAVVENRHAARLDLLAVLARRGGELDVVTLPDGRRLAGVDEWGGDAVDGAAVVVLALEAIAIEHLDFVAALDVDAAVAAALAGLLGHVGHPELDVQPEFAAEFLLGDDV